MEMIVIFNMGRDAAAAGVPAVAPDRVDYPKYGRVSLDAYAKREWLRGYVAEERSRLRRSLRAK